MVERSQLEYQWSVFGINVSDAILDKCEDICNQHRVDEEHLVETWMAYSLSKLEGKPPTLDTLAQMEREEYGKSKNANQQASSTPSGSSLVIYNSATSNDIIAEDLLNAYNKTPKGKSVIKHQHTPEQNGIKTHSGPGRSPRMAFSPASFSPNSSTPSRKYAIRTNAGEAVFKFGSSSDSKWRPTSKKYSPHIELHSESLHGRYQYMFEQLRAKGAVVDDVIDSFGNFLIQKHILEEPTNIKTMQPEPFTVVGQVCCDADGRLNTSSIILQGSQSASGGYALPLDVSQLPKYSLFPGQVIAAEVLNITGKKLIAKKLVSEATVPLPQARPEITEEGGPLQVVVAAGPYTPSDTMTYEPLEDLLKYIRKAEPHVAIFIGPFVDANHPHVENGSLAETFETFFEKVVDGIMQALEGLNTQVVMVPSWRDVHHDLIYPTPPFQLRKTYSNVHLMPDPCILNVQDVLIGVTSADALLHLGKEEISCPAQSSDRLGRLAGHILGQQCFYPVYPPAEEMSVDLEQWDECTHFKVTPHILVLPSDLRYFIKNIDGCVVVNPERLAKGVVGGTFARLEIHPPPPDEQSLSSTLRGEVVKI